MELTAPNTLDTFQKWWEDWKKRLAKKSNDPSETEKASSKIRIFEKEKSRKKSA